METESLKNLGIVMTQANLQQFALSKGIKASVKNMSEAQKVQLRYAFVMEKTANAQGDFARTGGGAANQIRIFQESLKQLGQQLGQTILPFVTKVITKVNEWVQKFSELSPAIKKIIVIVGALVAAIGPLLMIAGALATAISAITVPMLVIAGKVALVVAAIGVLVVAFRNLIKNNENFRNTAKKVWDKVSKTISKVGKSISGVFKTIMEIVKAFWDFFGPTIQRELGYALEVFANIFGGIGTIISGAFKAIQGTLQIFLGLFTGNWKKAWEGIINITKGALKIVDGLLKAMGFEVEGLQNTIDKLGQTQKKQTTAQMGRGPFSKGGRANINSGPFKRDVKEQTSVLDDLMGSFDDLGDVGVSVYDKLSDATERYVDILKSQIDTFKSAFGIFDKPMIERISGERLFVRMQAQTKLFEKWQNGLDVLRNKLGANSRLFQQVAAQGAGATGQVIGLAGLSTERLQQLESGMAQRGAISTQVATGLVGEQIRREQSAPTINLNGGVYVGDMADLANQIAALLKNNGV